MRVVPFVLVSLVALVTLATPSRGSEPPKQTAKLAPVELTGKVGDIIRLDAKFTGEVEWIVDYRMRTPDRHERVPGIKRLIVVPNAQGTYNFAAISVEGTKPVFQEFTVIVVGAPGPDPGPAPPQPPINTLDAKIKRAVAADIAAGKGVDKDRATLAATFQTLAKFADNELLTTVKHIKDLTNTTLSMAMTKGALPLTATEVSAHIRASVPEADDAKLTWAIRERVMKAFLELQTALEKAK